MIIHSKTAIVLAVLFASVMSAGAADLPETDVMLNLELLLVKSSGAYPMTTTELNATLGGKFHEIVKLEGDDPKGERLVYSLAHRMVGSDRISLTLERSVFRGRNERELPAVTETIVTLDSWTTILLPQDKRLGGELVLRVVPVLRQRKFDEAYDDWRTGMQLSHGPLVEFVDGGEGAPRHGQDRVVFRGINTPEALGLQLGIPDLGTVRVSHYPFTDAIECGWVRGARYHFEAGGRDYFGWSATTILPDDPRRPGKGWTLYCSLDTASPEEAGRSFYGVFDPAKAD